MIVCVCVCVCVCVGEVAGGVRGGVVRRTECVWRKHGIDGIGRVAVMNA